MQSTKVNKITVAKFSVSTEALTGTKSRKLIQFQAALIPVVQQIHIAFLFLMPCGHVEETQITRFQKFNGYFQTGVDTVGKQFAFIQVLVDLFEISHIVFLMEIGIQIGVVSQLEAADLQKLSAGIITIRKLPLCVQQFFVDWIIKAAVIFLRFIKGKLVKATAQSVFQDKLAVG